MKVLKTTLESLGQLPCLEPSAVTIGNFDGCHRGHQELIRLTRERALVLGAASVVLSFDPNPKHYFKPHRAVGKLFQPQQKIRALRELGVSSLIIQHFDRAFSQLSPETFYKDLLVTALRARALVVGHDFRFGALRQGDVEVLRKLAAVNSIEVHIVGQQMDAGQVISSSLIRQLLLERAIDRVNGLLARPYLLEGTVVVGKKLGRTLGFPTANLQCDEQLLPGTGVYAGFALVGREAPIFHLDPLMVPCIMNIGLRPTVEEHAIKPQIEVHLLDGQYASEALYQQSLSVAITDFIREEKKFSSLDSLREQIAQDCEEARQRLIKSRFKWA